MALVLCSAGADDSSGLQMGRAMEIGTVAHGGAGRARRTGHQLLDRLDDFTTQEELRALSDRYKRIADYIIEDLATPGGRSAT
jgi:hypothetical protein